LKFNYSKPISPTSRHLEAKNFIGQDFGSGSNHHSRLVYLLEEVARFLYKQKVMEHELAIF